jgi:hypothetical protein
MSGPDLPDEEVDTSLTPSEEEQEPEWAKQIRELRRQGGSRLEERLADDDTDQEPPLPDL